MVVTVFPLRPLTSRRMRMKPSDLISNLGSGRFFLHLQADIGLWHFGQIRTVSVEYHDITIRVHQIPELAPCVAVSKGRFIQHHFICDVMDGHGIDRDRHARGEEFVYRIATFNFEGDLAKMIGGTCSGGFGIEEDEYVVILFILYQSFHYPICSVQGIYRSVLSLKI